MDRTKFKVCITVAIILIGALATIIVGTLNTDSTTVSSEGTIIDFEDKDTKWTSIKLEKYSNALEVLRYACSYNGFELIMNPDGTVKSIDGKSSSDEKSWCLWTIEKGSTKWTKISAPYESIDLRSYTVSSWALRENGKEPTVAVDQSGKCIYGFGQSNRTISLSPSVTEMVASVGAVKTLVGTDKYSNYPADVVKMQNNGDISIVGDYTTPVYEDILKTDPDMVLCDGSQYNHVQVASKLNKNGINAIVLYNGESIDNILNNIFIIGQVLKYDGGAESKIDQINTAIDSIKNKLSSSVLTQTVRTMLSLSADMSPYVSGNLTYASDALTKAFGINVFSNYDGWTHVNCELVMKNNPSAIIILTTDYSATQKDYDSIIASLSQEWRNTDAYKNGNIYVLCEDAGEMAQRPSSRAAQLTELTARILNPDVFDDIKMPKYIGNDYRDYLTFTKNIE